MQTIKTAAIVVLLMSVIYGAYTSLSTPPESLPPGIEDMIVMDDSGNLSIESALPPSLGDLEINGGTLEVDPATVASATSAIGPPATGPTLATQALAALPAMGNLSHDSLATADSMAAVSTAVDSMAGDPVTQIASADPRFSTSASLSASPGYSASLSDRGPTVNASADSANQYASTGRTFQMPDPTQLDASLIGGQAQPLGHSQRGNGQPGNGRAENTSPTGTSPASPRSNDPSVSQVSAIDSSHRNLGLANAIRTADLQYQKDERKEALSTLSIFYSTPHLSGEQRSELLSRLDPLAAAVIYSPEHLLERPHRVGSDETLVKIAQRYEVPWQLLANINQVRDPIAVLPGTELKVVRGPFRAEVDLALGELTLFLGDLYAGRFPIAVGHDPAPRPGTFTVQDKQASKVFYDPTGAALPPGNPENPYGKAWIDLGGNLCIHGSPSTTSPSNKGCISLAADHADDLYGILSLGSTIVIK